MTITELIEALTAIRERHGDLVCGGEVEPGYVKLIVCDKDGHDIEDDFGYCGPAHDLCIEVR